MQDEETNKYYRVYRTRLIQIFGSVCFMCGSDQKLEFAHKKSTELNGKGRGTWTRFYDICKYPERYFLLCHDCHYKFDNPESIQIAPSTVEDYIRYLATSDYNTYRQTNK